MSDMRVYIASQVVTFRRVAEPFGGLSNMAPSPISINGIRFKTCEALYQACRFENRTDIQLMIANERSPMQAKRLAHQHVSLSRHDWMRKRFNIMRWCLRQKYLQNPSFKTILRATDDKPIVESSARDQVWGAIPQQDGTLVGVNVLGRLLMELRMMDRRGMSEPELKWTPDITITINGLPI